MFFIKLVTFILFDFERGAKHINWQDFILHNINIYFYKRIF